MHVKIYIDESPPGSGKTYRAINSIVDRKCKVIFAVEKIERFDELKTAISAQAKPYCTRPTIKAISSSQGNRHGSVVKEVSRVFEDFASDDHAVVLISHAALTSCNFEDAQGWEIIVDEVPAMLAFEQKQTHLASQFFEDHYQLEKLAGEWTAVQATARGLALTVSALKSCESHSHLAQFHQRVLEASREGSHRVVLCNLARWQDMASPGVQWCWASVFSLLELENFEKVTLLGNCFKSDVAFKISQNLCEGDIEWEEMPPLNNIRQFKNRQASIHYFSEKREASSSLFQSTEGQEALRQIGEHIKTATLSNSLIWSANDSSGVRCRSERQPMTPKAALEYGGMPTDCYLSPRQAGTNAHSSKSCAAMIYAAKPSPNMISLLELVGVDSADWKSSVEHEAILQFMTRTSIRDADSSAPLTFWVFDRVQAEYLRSSFDRMGYVNSTIEFVEGGPEIPMERKRGPKPAERTPSEQRAYADERRARDAARKRADRKEAKQKGQRPR